MTPHRERGRCVCGCPREVHDHYRAGTDCGHCGAATCRRFVPIGMRDNAILTAGQKTALSISDAQLYRTLAVLIACGHTQSRYPAPVDEPELPPGAIPEQRPTPERERFRDRRPLLIPGQVAAEARERNRARRDRQK